MSRSPACRSGAPLRSLAADVEARLPLELEELSREANYRKPSSASAAAIFRVNRVGERGRRTE